MAKVLSVSMGDERIPMEAKAQSTLDASLKDVMRTLARMWFDGDIELTPDDIERLNGKRSERS